MTDILLITSTIHGDPDPNGGHGHFVTVGPNSHLRVINQLTDGGHFPQDDCAVACTMTVLLERGISVSGLTIEHDEGTTAGGTVIEAIAPTLSLFGVNAHIANGLPPAGWVGNPATGQLFSPWSFPQYAAAAVGRYVAVDSPPPQPQGDDDMGNLLELWWPQKNENHDFEIDGAGLLHHNWPGPGSPSEIIQHSAPTLPVLRPNGPISGEIQPDGTCRLLVEDAAGNRFVVYQGPTEGIWHIAGEPN